MIETLEEYQRIMKSTHNMVAGLIELEATFGALCKVARAARFAKFMAATSLDVALNDELRKLRKALDAVPKWLLEGEEKDPGYFFSGLTDLQGIPLKKPDAEGGGRNDNDDDELSIGETTCCLPGSHVFQWTSQEKPNGELPEDTRCDCGRYFVGRIRHRK